MGLFVVILSTALLSIPAFAGGMVQHDFATDAAQNGLYTNVSGSQKIHGAEDFVQELSTDGIAFLQDKSLSAAERKVAFKTLLTSRFDIEKIGRFSMGSNWRTATPAQQTQYQAAFKTMLIDVYAQRFSSYQGQVLKVGKARLEGSKDIMVASNLVGKGQPTVSVDWRLRESGGTFNVIDVIVEGVSMAVTQRADFTSVIQRGGGNVQVLIDHLTK